VYDSVFVEERNRPTVTFVYKYFLNDAGSAASSKGMSNLRVVPETIVSECTDMEDIEAGVDGAMDEIIKSLTIPLTAEEKSPSRRDTEKPARIVFKGNLEEVNRFFYKRGWSDGLPITPPTEEAVAEMLTGTDLPPDHVVATLVPRKGKATVEKIAINAVMAGALPTYMPVLIAGTRALLTNRIADMMAVSTGAWAPFWIINGPIRQQLNINSSYGAMSMGDIANITIGRAMGLITKNIRGIRKGMEDMGVLGNPGKFAMVAAENEEENPWEPLHVEHGLKKEDNAISLSFPQCYDQIYPFGTDDKGLLYTMCYNLTPYRMGVTGFILTPTNARALAKKGWNKKSIKEFVYKNATIPWSRHPDAWAPFSPTAQIKPHNPDDQVPIIVPGTRPPELIQIYVFGGYGSWVGIASGGSDINTEKIELPANWDKLVRKYKDLVPTYVRY
jgi:hypothetical protein